VRSLLVQAPSELGALLFEPIQLFPPAAKALQLGFSLAVQRVDLAVRPVELADEPVRPLPNLGQVGVDLVHSPLDLADQGLGQEHDHQDGEDVPGEGQGHVPLVPSSRHAEDGQLVVPRRHAWLVAIGLTVRHDHLRTARRERQADP
jgi:hypothetical protein